MLRAPLSRLWRLVPLCLLTLPVVGLAGDGNRLTYLDESDPYYVNRRFPKLITPQWVGEEGVEAVIVLAIDDLRGLGENADAGMQKYEGYLRPILDRLKKIDGRAAVSIMTNRVEPDHPQLQKWLAEGVSLDCHTYDHPCPLLKEGDFDKARGTYERCVDLMHSIAGNRPVAHRQPCCDSLNTLSPRFFAEIFNHTTEKGNYLALDSSVFLVFTSDDPDLPRSSVLDADGQDKFRKYIPHDRSFVNTIFDYPYPYVINRLCWEIPCITPSDWSAQHRQQPHNPQTVRDWQAAIDATVAKRGMFSLVFHPHGWIRNVQVVELIDYAQKQYGNKVKFLTFREVEARLRKNLLGGQSLRAENGQDNGIRLADVNRDGYLNVLIGNAARQVTRLWQPEKQAWQELQLPVPFVTAKRGGDLEATGVRLGTLQKSGYASLLVRSDQTAGAWHFTGSGWQSADELLQGLELGGQAIQTSAGGRDRGVRFRDFDGDGRCELLVSNANQQAVFAWNATAKRWQPRDWAWPEKVRLVDAQGRDAGLRFVDLNEDARDDLIFSDGEHQALYLWASAEQGWSRKVIDGPGDEQIPPIVRRGTNNGAWFHSRHLWVQNEDTARLPNLVDRRSFNQLLGDTPPEPKSPEGALSSMHVRPGFQIELVAAEPLVMDPVSFDWGPDGKLWVVEMADYPLGVDGQGKPGGRVRFLEDTDGDGKYDQSTLFLDGLGYPNGVAAWRKGILVSCVPEIFYAEDSDGDGKCDVRKTLFSGFPASNPQHRMCGFWWGLDNWLHCGGDQHLKEILCVESGQKIAIGNRDFRIRPDEGLLDPQTGQTQYVLARDDWGNWFGCNNSRPCFHFALADQYLRRNPFLKAPNPRVEVPRVPGASPVYPTSRTLARFNDQNKANRFTSACGISIYRDGLFGESYRGNTFVSEPVHNLVHREVVSPQGVTFVSERAVDEQRSEFLSSSDNWFRPATTKTGPDGALWVADMYRHVIEHPEWIPPEWQQRLDLRAGHDKGRIYRIYPVDKPLRKIPRTADMSLKQLVSALESPNGPQRDMAHQMLLWRKDQQAAPLLTNLLATSQRPQARLHALCVLEGLGAVNDAHLLKGLADAHPGVRRHAIRLSEPRLAHSDKVAAQVLSLVADEDPHVQMQLAYSLGEWTSPKSGAALGKLALAHADDPYLRTAVLSSAVPNIGAMVRTIVQDSKQPAAALLQELLAMATAAKNQQAVLPIVEAVARPAENEIYAAWQVETLRGLLDALDSRRLTLAEYRKQAEPPLQAALDKLEAAFAYARKTVRDDAAALPVRKALIPLLGRGATHREGDVKLLTELLSPRHEPALQRSAVAAIGRLRNDRVPELLLANWRSYGPAVRAEVLDVLFSRSRWQAEVLDAVENKQLLVADLDAARRQLLLSHRDQQLRARAEKLLSGGSSATRQKVLEQYKNVLTLAGNAVQGQQLFEKKCSVCHKIGDKGHPVGPDLTALTDKSPQAMLTAILDPNKAVESKFLNYIAITADGRTLTGLLASETGGSVELVAAEGKKHVIARADLEELQSSGKSLMPEGLEKDLKPQDLADVIAYLGNQRPPRKKFPGNVPKVVEAEALRGEFWLLPSDCEIYGKTLVLEKKYGNLGYWQSAGDMALWKIKVTQPGRYRVSLEYACAPQAAGNTMLLEAAGQRLRTEIQATGSWDAYQRINLGHLRLPAGEVTVGVRASGKIDGALLDLKAIGLRPAR